MSWTNYGRHGRKGAWEIDHSVARANGGTDRLNNLKPACTSCNREKQDMTTRGYRARSGVTKAPLSRDVRRHDAKVEKLVVGGLFVAGAVWLITRLRRDA